MLDCHLGYSWQIQFLEMAVRPLIYVLESRELKGILSKEKLEPKDLKLSKKQTSFREGVVRGLGIQIIFLTITSNDYGGILVVVEMMVIVRLTEIC